MYEIATTIRETDRAFFYIFAVSVFFLVGVTFVMVWFVIRYNKKRHPVAADIDGCLPLEIAWTVIPTLLALGMFYFGWLGFSVIRNVPRGATEIEVTGRMFFWTFKYANGRQSKELHVPVGKPVRLNLKSTDVIHSFYVPAFKIKQDCVPGQDTYMSFTPLRAGTYDVACAEFCGTGHSTMLTRLVVLPPKDFDLWLTKPTEQKPLKMTDAMAGSDGQIVRGQGLYRLFCTSCHSADGRGKGVADARNFTSTKDWKNGSKVSEMFRTVDKGLGAKMPSFAHLPVDVRFAVIHYVRRFAQGHPEDTPEEITALDVQFKVSEGQMPDPELSIPDAMEKIASEAEARRTGTAPAAEPAAERTPLGPVFPALTDAQLARLRQAVPRGAALYAENCASCHRDRGQGRRTISTLDETWEARLESLALNAPNRPWRRQGVDALHRKMETISIATGGLKPAFKTFSGEDWRALHLYILGLLPGNE